MMLAVLHPWVLWLLPLSLLPFLLNRRSDDATRRVVSALHLWPATPPPPQRAPRVSRFIVDRRRSLLATLVALIVIALAGPFRQQGRADVVLIVDASASMGSRLDTGTRLDRGREEALTALEGAGIARVRLIAAGASPDDRGRHTPGGLRGALAAVTPGATRGDLAQAATIATTLEPGAPIWVVTDHAVTGVARTFVADAVAENIAITALIAEAGPDGTIAVTAQIENTAATRARATLAIVAAGERLADEPVALDPRSAMTWTRVLRTAAPAIAARLTPEGDDALPTDNARAAVVSPAAPVRVRLEADTGPAIARAVAANPAFSVTTGEESDVVVCRRCQAEADRPAVLRLGAGAASSRTRTTARVIGPPHPVTAGLAGLDATVSVGDDRAPSGVVLLRAGGAAAVSIVESPSGRAVTLHADDTDASFTRSAFFAVLAANAIDWLAGRDNPVTLDAGEPLRWWTGGAPAATLSGPDGRERPARLERGWLVSPGIPEPGLYTIRTPRGTARLAVTPPAAESALAEPIEALTVPAARPSPATPQQPLAPWLLAAALALALLEWRAWPRAEGSVVPRAICALALAAAVIGLQVPAGRSALGVVFAVDRSDSVRLRDQLAAIAAVDGASRRMREGDAAGLIAFGRRPLVLRAPAAGPMTTDAGVEAESGDTNIESAIRAALPLVPHDGSGRIVLATDGWETAGRGADAAAEAADARVALDVLPVASRSTLPYIRSVSAPVEVRAGESFSVDVAVAGPAGRTAAITLDGGDDAVSANVPLGPDGTARARLPIRRSAPGVAMLRARTGDEPEAFATGAAVTVLGPPRLLHVVAGDGAPTRVVAPAGMRIDRVPALRAPVGEAALAPYQLVVLDGVAGESLTGAAATALAGWTQDGGGLVVLGSEHSLPPGGYGNAAIDALLPVDLRVAPGARAPGAATVVAIDKSGSMADSVNGMQKIEAARDAVRRVSRALAPGDAFGVVAFDIRANAVAAPGPAARGEALDAALSALTPSGATRIAPAVELAATWLGESGVARRHLLVVSDGRTSADDLDRAGTLASGARITLSVIAIGADADRAGLAALAARTGGRVYFPTRLADLPRLAASDVVASRGGATVTTPVALRPSGVHPALAGLALDRLPTLGGYVVTAPRPGAEPVLDSALSDPVIVTGRAGLGRVVVVTTDLGSAWSTALRSWPGYPALMGQVLQWASRHDSAAGLDLAIEDTPAGASVHAWFERGIPARPPVARLRTPDNRVIDLRFRPVSAQLATATLPVSAPGLYRIDLTAGDSLHLVRGFVRQADRERAAAGVDEALLEQLMTLTGGRRLAPGDDPYDVPRPLAFVPASPILEILALGAVIALAAGGRSVRRARDRQPVNGAAA